MGLFIGGCTFFLSKSSVLGVGKRAPHQAVTLRKLKQWLVYLLPLTSTVLRSRMISPPSFNRPSSLLYFPSQMFVFFSFHHLRFIFQLNSWSFYPQRASFWTSRVVTCCDVVVTSPRRGCFHFYRARMGFRVFSAFFQLFYARRRFVVRTDCTSTKMWALISICGL